MDNRPKDAAPVSYHCTFSYHTSNYTFSTNFTISSNSRSMNYKCVFTNDYASFYITIYIYCTKSLARWLALRTIRSPLFFKNKSSSFFVYVILLSYHTQTITHKRTAMLMLSCFFILNNYISDFFIRPPPFRCLFLLFL